MALLTYILLICLSRHAVSTDNVSGNGLTETMRRSLDFLCPGVDICNTSSLIVRPNELIRFDFLNSFINSCCQGCSCHEDCSSMLNCCFPNNKNDELVENDISLVNSRRSFNTRDLGPFLGEEGTPDDIPRTKKTCIYAQTGTPEEEWMANVPAYSMISSPPPSGCKPDHDNEAASLQGTCGLGDVQTFGDLLPVYATESGEIYQNELCARCHGVYEYINWQSILVCNIKEPVTNRTISISEHFASLKQNASSNNCFIAFEYYDYAMVADNRCFAHTIQTCSLTSSEGIVALKARVNMTLSDITDACMHGLVAPVFWQSNVYRNAFCAVCNVESPPMLLCFKQDDTGERSFGSSKSTYLLDKDFLAENDIAGEKTFEEPELEACMQNGFSWVEESCRNVFCPTGQIRNTEGLCEFPSKHWFHSYFTFIVKLEYTGNTKSIFTMLESGQVDTDTFIESLQKTNPWPPHWYIQTIYHSSDDEVNAHSMAVVLVTEINEPEILIDDIRDTMTAPWSAVVKGTHFLFEQSILEFTLRLYGKGALLTKGPYVPSWKYYAEKLSLNLTLPENASIEMMRIYHKLMPSSPLTVHKLFTCDHISLRDDEYSLMAEDSILVNKLTGRILFDKEFDLVKNGNSRVEPRICLSDSPFLLKHSTNGASLFYGIAFSLGCMHVAQRIVDVIGLFM